MHRQKLTRRRSFADGRKQREPSSDKSALSVDNVNHLEQICCSTRKQIDSSAVNVTVYRKP